MSTPFQTSRLVEFSDTDMAGIMHFAAFFRYMESAEHEMLRSWGYSIFDEHEGQTISFPRVAASCQYHAPARSEDVLEITVAVLNVGNKAITYQFEFHCQGKRIATGEVVCVCCRIEHGLPPKSIPIPDDLAARLRSVLAE
jgi:4-hydroxybenzoyl-CoA thioesterase/acyl-CoA thioester hydrolase